jgi:hypothetical protein
MVEGIKMPYVSDEKRKYPYKPKVKVPNDWKSTPIEIVEAKLVKTIQDVNEKIAKCPKCIKCGYICHFEFGVGYSQFCAPEQCINLSKLSKSRANSHFHKISKEGRDKITEGVKAYWAKLKGK